MNDSYEPQAGPVVEVARNLSEIERLADALEAQAIAQATDRLMPGGAAMVALGPVANLEAWQNRVDTALRMAYENGLTLPTIDDDSDDEPPLQTLLFWSEEWRREHGYELDGRLPSLSSEAAFLRWALNWAWDNEVKFDDFAKDVRATRARLENLLHAGRRSDRGVQCFDCQVDLIRPSRDLQTIRHCDGHDGVCTIPHRHCPHDRGGLADEWVCPSCERRYDEDSYRRAVTHAHFVHAAWLPLELCAERTGEKPGTIKVWAHRGKVAKRRDLETGRMLYSVEDTLAQRPDETVAS